MDFSHKKKNSLSSQLDAGRDEEEVFCDISATLDNKLFPSQESAAGKLSFYFDLNISMPSAARWPRAWSASLPNCVLVAFESN